jgi:hypothetical protein
MFFSDRLSVIQERIARAAKGRAVRLVAVSKFHPVEAVAEALAAEQFCFGENRVQEAASKFPALREAYPQIELNLIGPLQTNKVDQAVALFDVIQTLDRPRLAEALARAFKKTARRPRLYIEVNLGAEPQKAGIAPEELKSFLKESRDVWGLKIEGLMAIPPFGQDPVPYFRQLVALADRFGLQGRSIGMSDDFESAIACGATEVRVGTALFGVRGK